MLSETRVQVESTNHFSLADKYISLAPCIWATILTKPAFAHGNVGIKRGYALFSMTSYLQTEIQCFWAESRAVLV